MKSLRLLLLIGLTTPSVVLAQSNYCPRDGFDESIVWTVDAGTNAACEPSVGCPSGGVCIMDPGAGYEYRCKGVVDTIRIMAGTTNPAMSEAQVLNVLDTSLQNWMRTSRARGRAKISSQTAPCTVDGSGSTPCIGFSDASFCQAPFAVGDCAGGNCRIALCLRKWRPAAWVTTDNNSNAAVLAHEVGHALGLNHAGDCGAGCSGELMCASGNRSHLLAPGDARGARNALQGTPDIYTHRFVGSGSRALGGVSIATQPFIHPTNNNPIAGSHLGRIDCASYANGYAQCAAVVPYQLNDGTSKMRIVALKGWSETQGWTSAFVVAEFDAENNLAPDIALSPYGNEAYFVQSTSAGAINTSGGNPLKIGRVDMATGAVTSAWLGMGSILPPRIDFSEDGVVVVGQRVASSGQAPRWVARRAQWTGKSFTFKTLDFGNLDDAPAENGTRLVLADFDFACRHNLTAADQCVLVAPLFEEGNANFRVGSVSSRQFSVASAGKVTMASAWTHSGDLRATAVTGVTLAPGPTLVVSTSRRSANGSNSNSLMREYSGYSVTTAVSSLVHRSDVNTNCENATVNGVQIGAATPHGGVALDWCAQCGGGRIETLQFYREVGAATGAFCF